jgi:hypothetical protein
MEEAMDLHIDAKTLQENFSKNEIKIIKQLQDIGLNGGAPPQMTQQGRNTLMEKLHNINNKPIEKIDTSNMNKEELDEYKKELRVRIQNKINFKKNSRMAPSNQTKTNNTTFPSTQGTTSTPNTNIAPDLTDVDNLKNILSQMTNSQSNPEIKKRFDELFGTNDLGDLLKDEKTKQLMEGNGFNELFNNFAKQMKTPLNPASKSTPAVIQKSTENSESTIATNKKKSRKRNKKKKKCVIENINDNKNTHDDDSDGEELLDDYVNISSNNENTQDL